MHNIPHTKETKEKISKSLKNHIRSPEHCRAISEARKIQYKKSEKCPHCNYTGSGPVMRRWHFSNCKYYK